MSCRRQQRFLGLVWRTYNQPVAKVDEGGGPQSRAITLRTTPGSGKGRHVDVVLRLRETSARKTTRRIRHGLQVRLRVDVFGNDFLQTQVAVAEEVDQDFRDESSISRPGIVVYRGQ